MILHLVFYDDIETMGNFMNPITCIQIRLIDDKSCTNTGGKIQSHSIAQAMIRVLKTEKINFSETLKESKRNSQIFLILLYQFMLI